MADNRSAALPAEGAILLDRRSMLGTSVGAALSAALAGSLPAVVAEAAQGGAGSRGSGSVVSQLRLVVTGHNPQGKSCVVRDEMVSPGRLWTTSATDPVGEGTKLLPTELPPRFPADVDPPVGGTRITFTNFAPATDSKPSLQNRSGFHRTSTIDYAFVLSDGLVLLLDVEEVNLKAGDVVVQRNTSHAWRNDGQTPAGVLVVLARV
jgi:hypothetical protein